MNKKPTEVQRDYDRRKSLVDLATELLVIIMSYLPARDIMAMRYVSRRFKHVTETPSLWKEFVWPECEPRYVDIVADLLKTNGEHMRRIFFPAHVTPVKILEMAHCCTKVTHLSLPRNTQLSLDHLEEIVHAMAQLQELDIFLKIFSQYDYNQYGYYDEGIARLLAFTSGKKLVLRCMGKDMLLVLVTIREKIYLGNTRDSCGENAFSPFLSQERPHQNKTQDKAMMPSILNILIDNIDWGVTHQLLEYWLDMSSILPSFEFGLYEIRRMPLSLYPSIPLRKFQFGPTVTPPFVKLSRHGIQGLEHDTFYLNDYDHYGEVKYTITPKCTDLFRLRLSRYYFSHISNLYSVSNVNLFGMDIYPSHLEQLAIVCPNLERLNLMKANNCLQSLDGLRAIVQTCRNLQGLNLVEISISSVESFLLFWELLSSVKKLTHLAIELCMLITDDRDDANKQKLISMLRSCVSLQALEIVESGFIYMIVDDLLFSYFPSLVYVKLSLTKHLTAFNYTITNCHQLKYLCYENNSPNEVLSSRGHLLEVCIKFHFASLSASSVVVLSAHGKLERVDLHVKSITFNAITTLINNSPNLFLLHISSIEPLCDEGGTRLKWEDCVSVVSKTFSYHKLFAAGDFIVKPDVCIQYKDLKMLVHFSDDINSFWTQLFI